MNFDKTNPEFVKWCKTVGIGQNDMPQNIWPKIFKCLNDVMDKSKIVSPSDGPDLVDIEDEPAFEDMSDDELRQYITDNGGTFHHMNKREKLIEIAKAL